MIQHDVCPAITTGQTANTEGQVEAFSFRTILGETLTPAAVGLLHFCTDKPIKEKLYYLL